MRRIEEGTKNKEDKKKEGGLERRAKGNEREK
jgi:hypothetical protein